MIHDERNPTGPTDDDQLFRSLADTVPAMLWATDADGRCSFLSRGWCEFTGQTEATGLGSGWLDAIHPDDRPVAQARFESAYVTREPLVLEYRLRRADGEYRFVVDAARARLGPQGELQGYAGSVIDITERKRVAERFRIAADAADAVVYDMAVGAGLDTADVHGIEHILGADGRQAQLTSAWWDSRIHPDDLSRHQATVSRSVDDPTCTGYRSEYRIRHTDGFWRSVDDRAQIQRGADGRATRIIGTILDVSARKQVEHEARRGQEHLELLSDTVPALISYVGPDRCYRTCNAEYSKWFGLRREQLIGRPMREVLGPEAWRVVGPHVERAFAGKVSEFEAEVDYRYGGRRWIHARYTPHRDSLGAVIGVVILVTDISGRKQSEHARARLAAIVDSSDDAIISKNLDGTIMSWNKSATRLFGYSADEAIGKPVTMLIPADRLHEETVILARVRAGSLMPAYDTVRRRKDGSLVDVSLSVSPIIEEGKIVGASKIARDITARKQVEERIRQSREALSGLVERAPFGVFIVDSQLRITQMNAGSQTGAFRNVRPVIGRDLGEALRIIWPPEVAAEALAVFRRTLATGEPYISRNFTQARRDIDAVESYEWEVHRLRLPDGQYGVATYYFDSTRLRQAEQALREADRRKDEFLATLAHELRNPLAPIRNGLQILRLAGSEQQSTQQVLEMIERQLSHLIRLVDDLMEVARVTRGKIELRREPIDLATVVRNAVDTSRPLIEAARHELTVDVDTEPLTVMADPVRLAQVIANLLNNAAKYTDEGGRIFVRAGRDGASAIVSVRDNGVGIPSDMLAHVFDLFAQANRTYQRAQGGLGIGLTLVRSLVELHGGSVVAKSDGPGLGSEFIVRLPLGLELPAGGEPTQTQGTGELGAHRILVVDDSRDAAESLAILLRHLGADVQIAGDGQEALAVLETYRPSVVLLDIGMPGMDGFEVARRARQRQSGRDATLIALSGWGQDEDRRRSEEAGIDYHFVKPVDVDALTRLLTALSRSERVHGSEADGATARPH